ncbi:tRNA(Ile)-lysidine synthase [Deinococcus malanensis]|uniref:Multifunctional fusion protein n=1 Tax=Deinococcus malanensis TaxID=1706855 RepID=A0ABQ2ENG2_9DEIO|nr:tRNA lysidine(34) synthetase TilS [Deinococcus malanensis]GGK14102.1 tRNA(Ile)-lysidine synthase [Deinococcus malanensis]
MSTLLAPLRPYAGRAVVVGVSGGADSVALLRALVQVRARPVVVHLDHALRPGSAEDAAWVQAFAAQLRVGHMGTRVDVAAVAARRGWNMEDAARRIRYEVLGRGARQHGAEAVLTAHTRRDQAETVLMELLRGEAALTGIPSVRGRVRRPWLDVSRSEIEGYLEALGQDWREDPTNADVTYTRAWLRAEVMPVLAARFPGIEAALARVAKLSQQDNQALNDLAAALTPHGPREQLPLAVLRRRVAQELRAASLPFHAGHIDQLAQAHRSGETRHVTLPGGQDITVTGGALHLGGHLFASPAFSWPDGWTLRKRQAGDRIRLPGGTRKLSDLLTDLKVPRQQRDQVPLLVSGQGVEWIGLEPNIWAVGAREAAGQKADPVDTAMGEALMLAHEAALAQEVPVGAVVLDPAGRVVGRGCNTSRVDGDMTRHAELAALRAAAAELGTPYLSGCTLVVTLEPCPMCLGAALEARVGRIVYGARNPRAGALGGVSDLLTSNWGHVPTVTGGVRAKEAARLLRASFQELRRRKSESADL